MKNNHIKPLIFALLVFFTLSGCNIIRPNPDRKAKKQQEKENKKLKKAYESDVKSHYKMQSAETKKRMKKNLNKVRKDTKGKKGKSKWKCS